MATPAHRLKEIDELVADAANGKYPEDGVALATARCIVEHRDAALLVRLPPYVASMLEELIAGYKRDGKVHLYSNVGTVDLTDLIRELATVLESTSV